VPNSHHLILHINVDSHMFFYECLILPIYTLSHSLNIFTTLHRSAVMNLG